MLEPVNTKYFKMAVGKLKKDTANEISCCCPVCGDDKDRLHLYWTEVGDLVHCFNDGCELSDKHHTIRNFLSIAAPGLYEQYRRETFKGTIKALKETESLQDIMQGLNKPKPKPKKSIPLDNLFMSIMDSEAGIKYVKTRGIKEDIYKDWYFSEDRFFEFEGKKVFLKNYIIIPIFQDEKYRGFYSRSITAKNFSTFLLPDIEKIWTSKDEYPEIICEGIFDALSTGFESSGAMLSASLSKEYTESLPKSTIIALDNDQTGVRKAKKFLQDGFRVFVWPDSNIVKEKDFNEMLQSGYKLNEIKEIILNNTFSGIIGKVKLGIKEK